MVNRVVRKDCKVEDETEAYLKKSSDLNQGCGSGSGCRRRIKLASTEHRERGGRVRGTS